MITFFLGLICVSVQLEELEDENDNVRQQYLATKEEYDSTMAELGEL